jgi:hypothetical protein
MEKQQSVVVFGSSRCREGSAAYEQARECGRLLGAAGITVISGGYDGSMGAVSRGARDAGGRVEGITTRIFADREANPWLDEIHEEIDYPARMSRLLRSGTAYLALPGGLGTLSEWSTAWCLASIGQLGGPLWAFRQPWKELHDAIVQLPEVSPAAAEIVGWLDGPAELDAILANWRLGL